LTSDGGAVGLGDWLAGADGLAEADGLGGAEVGAGVAAADPEGLATTAASEEVHAVNAIIMATADAATAGAASLADRRGSARSMAQVCRRVGLPSITARSHHIVQRGGVAEASLISD